VREQIEALVFDFNTKNELPDHGVSKLAEMRHLAPALFLA
jgi:hypothetical protein